jgi:hypothetical protein
MAELLSTLKRVASKTESPLCVCDCIDTSHFHFCVCVCGGGGRLAHSMVELLRFQN